MPVVKATSRLAHSRPRKHSIRIFLIAFAANCIFALQAICRKRNPLCSAGDTTSLTCRKINLPFLTRNRRGTRSKRAFLRDQKPDLLAQPLYDHVLEYLSLRGWPRYQVCVIDRHRSILQKLAARNVMRALSAYSRCPCRASMSLVALVLKLLLLVRSREDLGYIAE